MPRFRKKPTEVEAWQWNGIAQVRGVCYCGYGEGAHVHTSGVGAMQLEQGDWIVPDGGYYIVMAPKLFAATYELIAELRKA